MENKTGPNIDLCGTPHLMWAEEEETFPNSTGRVLRVKYKANHLRTFPWIPAYILKLSSDFSCTTVSNAAVWSFHTVLNQQQVSRHKRYYYASLQKSNELHDILTVQVLYLWTLKYEDAMREKKNI